jgi:HSP20 family protein
MNKEDIKVTVEGGVLSITGERKVEKEEKHKKNHRIERSYGTLNPSFTLPEATSADKVLIEPISGMVFESAEDTPALGVRPQGS